MENLTYQHHDIACAACMLIKAWCVKPKRQLHTRRMCASKTLARQPPASMRFWYMASAGSSSPMRSSVFDTLMR